MPVLRSNPVAAGVSPATASHNQRLWAELHHRAAHGAYFVPSDSPVPEIENQWLRRFALRIRCKKCRSHWLRLVRDNPPDFRTRSRYFSWTVKLHNFINVRIGKPIVTFHAAKKLWRFDTPANLKPES